MFTYIYLDTHLYTHRHRVPGTLQLFNKYRSKLRSFNLLEDMQKNVKQVPKTQAQKGLHSFGLINSAVF